MIVRTPDFYKNFKCIADKCSDTCCVGWEIDIDEESQNRYSKVSGDFGKILQIGISDGHFKLTEGDRCPFLDSNNLCEIYRHLGPNALCDICREHPRFVEVYGNIKEQGVGLCCEEAARLLLAGSGRLQFECSQDSNPGDNIPKDALEARDAILQEREIMFDILTSEDVPFQDRLHKLLDFAIEVSGQEDADNPQPAKDFTVEEIIQSWAIILTEGESFGPAWDRAIVELKSIDAASLIKQEPFFSSEELSRIISYELFRYYGKSLFDGDSLSKVQFALFFTLSLQFFGRVFANVAGTYTGKYSDKVNAIKLLSKQVEYSDEIMELLNEKFFEDHVFSNHSFHLILDSFK